MVGRARFTTVLSSITMNRAKHMVPRVMRLVRLAVCAGMGSSEIRCARRRASAAALDHSLFKSVDVTRSNGAAALRTARRHGSLTLLERGQTLDERPRAVGHEVGVVALVAA